MTLSRRCASQVDPAKLSASILILTRSVVAVKRQVERIVVDRAVRRREPAIESLHEILRHRGCPEEECRDSQGGHLVSQGDGMRHPEEPAGKSTARGSAQATLDAAGRAVHGLRPRSTRAPAPRGRRRRASPACDGSTAASRGARRSGGRKSRSTCQGSGFCRNLTNGLKYDSLRPAPPVATPAVACASTPGRSGRSFTLKRKVSPRELRHLVARVRREQSR